VRILVVEDEAKVARALQEALEAEHYEVVLSATGEDGYFRVNTGIEVGAACGQEQLKGRRAWREGETEFTHEGDLGTCEVLTKQVGLDDRALEPIRQTCLWISISRTRRSGPPKQ